MGSCFQQVLAGFFDMVVMMILFRWHLSLKYSSSVAKGMFKFTAGVIGTSFLDFWVITFVAS